MYGTLTIQNSYAELLKTVYLYGYIGCGDNFKSCKVSEVFQENTVKVQLGREERSPCVIRLKKGCLTKTDKIFNYFTLLYDTKTNTQTLQVSTITYTVRGNNDFQAAGQLLVNLTKIKTY